MKKTKAAIYVSAKSKQLLKTQIAELRKDITNNGCALRGNSCIYADIGSSKKQLALMLSHAQARKFQVLYVNYSYLQHNTILPVKQAVRAIYTYGLSAIVHTSTPR